MRHHIDTLSSFVVGLIFGIGLILAGMTDPSKVIGFLDVAGLWDPSLAFVMGGGVLVGLSEVVARPDARSYDVIASFPHMPAVIDGSQMQDAVALSARGSTTSADYAATYEWSSSSSGSVTL